MSRLVFAVYAALMWMARPLLRRKLARRAAQEPGYAENVAERFGHYPHPAEAVRTLVWVHAVSLGEMRTAGVLLEALRAAYPQLRVLLTHGTATGRAEGARWLRPGDVQVWQPWDCPVAVARFMRHFQPRLGLLMETEVWPCALAAARRRDIPMVLVNARMSNKSLVQALRLKPLALPAYGALAAVLAQTEQDAARYLELGVTASVVGNLKFDAQPDAQQMAQGQAWRRALLEQTAPAGSHAGHLSVLMFASSREGEEQEFFSELKALNADLAVAAASGQGVHPNSVSTQRRCYALVVPRHPQRFAEVAALVLQQGLSISLRSEWPPEGPAASASALAADIWLGDSVGEMPLFYSMASVALLGGSFAPLGGQNLIEAAACACPVVMGPHTFNFSDAAQQAEAAGAALRAVDMAAALSLARSLAQDSEAHSSAVAAGLAFAARNRGATAQTVAALQTYLTTSPANN